MTKKENTVLSNEIVPEPLLWLRFFPRWALITCLTSMTIPILFLGGIGQQTSDNSLGNEFVEILQAVRSPYMFRAAWASDAIVWLMLGGILISVAGLLRRHAPVQSIFILVCGIAQLLGAFGSFMRLDGISDLAIHYSSALPNQQIGILESYLNLSRVINSSNHIAVLLQGIGYLLVSFSTISLRGFPRWLAIWFALPGLLGIAQLSLFITGASYLYMLNVLGLVVGNIALNFAIMITLWRPPNLLVSSVSSKAVVELRK